MSIFIRGNVNSRWQDNRGMWKVNVFIFKCYKKELWRGNYEQYFFFILSLDRALDSPRSRDQLLFWREVPSCPLYRAKKIYIFIEEHDTTSVWGVLSILGVSPGVLPGVFSAILFDRRTGVTTIFELSLSFVFRI